MRSPRLLPLLLCPLALLAGAARAQGPAPSGTIRLESRSVAAGVGVSWGDGTLTLDEAEHRFHVSGLSVADVGISRVTATGHVYGLEKLADFEGQYYGIEAGVAVGGGTAGVALRNEKGVMIRLRAVQQGVKLSFASQGIRISLVPPAPEPEEQEGAG